MKIKIPQSIRKIFKISAFSIVLLDFLSPEKHLLLTSSLLAISLLTILAILEVEGKRNKWLISTALVTFFSSITYFYHSNPSQILPRAKNVFKEYNEYFGHLNKSKGLSSKKSQALCNDLEFSNFPEINGSKCFKYLGNYASCDGFCSTGLPFDKFPGSLFKFCKNNYICKMDSRIASTAKIVIAGSESLFYELSEIIKMEKPKKSFLEITYNPNSIYLKKMIQQRNFRFCQKLVRALVSSPLSYLKFDKDSVPLITRDFGTIYSIQFPNIRGCFFKNDENKTFIWSTW